MGLAISARPSMYMPTKNPITYRVFRRDAFYTTLINNGSGFYLMRFTGSNVAADYSPGDKLYLEGFGSINGLATVVTSTFTGGNTDVVLDRVYSVTLTSGYVNNHTKRPYYRITVGIFDGNTNAQLGPNYEFTTQLSGLRIFDISGLLDGFVSPLINESIDICYFNAEVNQLYYIKYREDWTGSANSFTDDSANKRVAICGRFYINDLPYDFVYDQWSGGTKRFLGRLFSDPNKNTYTLNVSRRQNFYVSFIADDITDTVWIEGFDKNDVSLGGTNYPIDAIGVNDVRVWGGTIVEDSLAYNKVWIKTSGGTKISDTLIIRPSVCKGQCNVAWRNSLGGLSTWTFKFSQDMDFQIVNGRKFRRIKAYDMQLTPDEWAHLQDMNTVTETYAVAITDSLTGFYTASDKQVDGAIMIEDPLTLDIPNLTGVYKNGTVNVTSDPVQTKTGKFNFSVEILLSEAP